MSKKVIFIITAFFAVIILTVVFNYGQDNHLPGPTTAGCSDSENLVLPIVGLESAQSPVLIVNVPYLHQGVEGNAAVLISSPDGELKKIPLASLAQGPYEPKICVDGDILLPTWENGVNKIFSRCPQVNVGIGTVNPKHKLEVSGTSLTTRLMVGPSSATGTGSTANVFVQNGSWDILRLGKKIGAGPEQVLFKVSNDGIVYTKEIWVRPTSEFPDYVFDPGYELMSLEELENYIALHGALPKMPKAFEVDTGGLNLNRLQLLLVEKVEEMTLYLIALNKEMETLRAELDQLKSVQ